MLRTLLAATLIAAPAGAALAGAVTLPGGVIGPPPPVTHPAPGPVGRPVHAPPPVVNPGGPILISCVVDVGCRTTPEPY